MRESQFPKDFRSKVQLTCEWQPSWTSPRIAFFMKFSSVIVLSNNVNSVYIVNSGCSFNSFLDVAISLSFFLEMVFGAGCVFPRHDTWRHGEVVISDFTCRFG